MNTSDIIHSGGYFDYDLIEQIVDFLPPDEWSELATTCDYYRKAVTSCFLSRQEASTCDLVNYKIWCLQGSYDPCLLAAKLDEVTQRYLDRRRSHNPSLNMSKALMNLAVWHLELQHAFLMSIKASKSIITELKQSFLKKVTKIIEDVAYYAECLSGAKQTAE